MIALNKILLSLSPAIKDALIKNKLVIQPLAGATNLNYELYKVRISETVFPIFEE